uniref:Uncharacterized protein n=1 Tax=Anguilla anguilla TaxID=7936 RepID=A0A0E9PBQ1_ANGAN
MVYALTRRFTTRIDLIRFMFSSPYVRLYFICSFSCGLKCITLT